MLYMDEYGWRAVTANFPFKSGRHSFKRSRSSSITGAFFFFGKSLCEAAQQLNQANPTSAQFCVSSAQGLRDAKAMFGSIWKIRRFVTSTALAMHQQNYLWATGSPCHSK